MTATAGRFAVTDQGEIAGPLEYLTTKHYRETVGKIERGDNAVVNYALMQGQPIPQAIAVALQTAYAGWKGTRQLLGR